MRRVIWNVPGERSKKPRPESLKFCVSAYRPKLQFKTLAEAQKHIDLNGPEILRENGKAPTRAYWCHSCCCFHVTSRLSSDRPDGRGIIRNLRLAFISKSIKDATEYLKRARRDFDRLKSPDQGMKSKIEALELELRKREYDTYVKKAEYLLRISDLSGATEAIGWLRDNDMNPGKTKSLQDVLEQKINP